MLLPEQLLRIIAHALGIAGTVHDRRAMQPPVTQACPSSGVRGGWADSRIGCHTSNPVLVEKHFGLGSEPTWVARLASGEGWTSRCQVAEEAGGYLGAKLELGRQLNQQHG
ncbi:hypothetical protein TomMM35A_27260 [Sphingobium sp. TomMM35A]